jgi:hypothetical protein
MAPTVAEPTPIPLPQESAVCWQGSVLSLPEGAEFDDFIRLMPMEAGELGIAGIDEDVEQMLIDMRDASDEGAVSNFSGTVTCNVQDVGGCRLEVEQVHAVAEAGESEPISVEGWEGTIVSAGESADTEEPELYFVLGGDFPVRYGVTAAETEFETALSELADSDVPVRVSGILSCGTTDTYGSMLVVTQVE